VNIKVITAAIILALAFVMVATGQRRAKRPVTPKAQPSATPTPTPLSTLSIEVGLVYKNGDVKPVARTRFYLLDEDLRVIFKTLGVDIGGSGPVFLGSKIAFERAINKNATNEKTNAAIAPHIIDSVVTDFSGRAKFEALTPGIRFVYGEYQVGRENIAWNTRIEVRAGADAELVLDNSN
jgi:hypothetical protein